MYTARLLIITLCCLCLPLATAKNDFELQFENFTCITNEQENIFERLHCGLNKNVKRRTMHMEFSLLQPLRKHEFHIAIIMPRPTVNFVLLNLSMDGCQFLGNKNQVPLLRISRSILDSYSNFPRQCPLELGKAYYIRAFRLDLNLIPAVTMETPVQMQFSYQRRQLKLMQGFITARVQRTSNAKKKDA
ncbi:CG14491 [Drosophila busckii]|uniref:CG14491 n=1 Tax=Drosophila busckii TaxID=30019 RepID=A0A0M4EHQ2_DROBS|nr:uncharacterized protein LOC108594881 [Drosophila busckii]ALC42160.1 CG14491 [Drosophila busckii]